MGEQVFCRCHFPNKKDQRLVFFMISELKRLERAAQPADVLCSVLVSHELPVALLLCFPAVPTLAEHAAQSPASRYPPSWKTWTCNAGVILKLFKCDYCSFGLIRVLNELKVPPEPSNVPWKQVSLKGILLLRTLSIRKWWIRFLWRILRGWLKVLKPALKTLELIVWSSLW